MATLSPPCLPKMVNSGKEGQCPIPAHVRLTSHPCSCLPTRYGGRVLPGLWVCGSGRCWTRCVPFLLTVLTCAGSRWVWKAGGLDPREMARVWAPANSGSLNRGLGVPGTQLLCNTDDEATYQIPSSLDR